MGDSQDGKHEVDVPQTVFMTMTTTGRSLRITKHKCDSRSDAVVSIDGVADITFTS